MSGRETEWLEEFSPSSRRIDVLAEKLKQKEEMEPNCEAPEVRFLLATQNKLHK